MAKELEPFWNRPQVAKKQSTTRKAAPVLRSEQKAKEASKTSRVKKRTALGKRLDEQDARDKANLVLKGQ